MLVDEVGEACTPVLTDVTDALPLVVVVAVCNGPPLPLMVLLMLAVVLSAASFMVVRTPPVNVAGDEARAIFIAAAV